MAKRAPLNNRPWPDNLIYDFNLAPNTSSAEAEAFIHSLSTSEKNKDFLRLRYQEGKTYADIGLSYGITASGIRQAVKYVNERYLKSCAAAAPDAVDLLSLVDDNDAGQADTPPPAADDTEKDEKSESGKSDEGGKSSDSYSDEGSKSSESKKTPEKKDDDGDSSNNLKLGGKECEVGDTVICTYYVTCPTKFINFQATLNYDSDKVNVEDAELSGSASSGSVINYDLDGKVKFNGIKLNGYNYAKGGAFLTVTYKVLDSGSTDPKITWEIVTDASNNAMIVNGEPISDFKVEAEYE